MHHRSNLGNFSILAPNVTILGLVKIGQKVYIGSSSTIKNDLKIKKGFIIGMGSVVTKSLIKGKLAYGQNAKIIE
jgi:acetyltransferase-like isoleucine patch superfamily enzyme